MFGKIKRYVVLSFLVISHYVVRAFIKVWLRLWCFVHKVDYKDYKDNIF